MLYNKEIRSRIIKKVNGIDMKILETKVEKKDNNTILLLHGFPEISYSFRHLMSLLAKSGYYCVAPDQRRTSQLGSQETKLPTSIPLQHEKGPGSTRRRISQAKSLAFEDRNTLYQKARALQNKPRLPPAMQVNVV